MNILIAPDSYKGSLGAGEVANAIQDGMMGVLPWADFTCLPMADGGEGTSDVLCAALDGTRRQVTVQDPLGRQIQAPLVILDGGRTVLVEMAGASGLTLLTAHERNPLDTSTYGTGQLIRAALDEQPERLIVTIGGSATNEGGMGMVRALGGRFLDGDGTSLAGTGADLGKVQRIDLSELDPRIRKVSIRVLCDVTNPFHGKRGAAHVYGAQKGASEEEIRFLDRGLSHFAGIVREQFDLDLQQLEGAGAAGGFGGGTAAFLRARLVPGVEEILDLTGFDSLLKEADLVVTGEGQTDGQTLQGKVPFGVLRRAHRAGVPVIIISGALGPGYEALFDAGVWGLFSIQNRPISTDESILQAREAIVETSRNLAHLLSRCMLPKHFDPTEREE